MIPNHNTYRSSIVGTIQALRAYEAELISKTLSILISGEWKEDMHEIFSEGKKFELSLSELESATDENVLVIVKLIKTVRKTISKLQTQNNIPDEEIGLLP